MRIFRVRGRASSFASTAISKCAVKGEAKRKGSGMEEFDYIIVGGGSAGCAVAGRLSETGRYKVALLEAGGSHKNPLVSIPFNFVFTVPYTYTGKNWGFETVPQPGLNGRVGYQPRGKSLGGSSSINAMVYIRGVKEDYDHWAGLGNTGWSYDDVLPFFKMAENHEKGASDFHGAGGPLSVSAPRSPNPMNEIFIKAGEETQIPRSHDFNGASQEGIGYFDLTQRRGARCSAAHAYLDRKANKNLTVFSGAFAHKILFDGKRATGIEANIRGKTQTLKARKEVILSAGAFQSPQLLLLSGVGPQHKIAPHGLEMVHELPGVGENLHDHLDYSLMYKSSSPHVLGENTKSVFKVGFDQLRYWITRRGILTTNYNEAGAFYYADKSQPSPDIQLHFAFALVDNHGRTRHSVGGYTCHICLLRPKSRGNLDLADANPETAPLIDPGFLADESDLDAMLRGVQKAQQIMEAPAFDEVRGEPLYETATKDEEMLREDIRNRADTIYHPVGTCKMGNDPMAVVDERLRVRGLQGLRVIDASIMPTIVSGNTNAPSIMIGEKGAAMILEDA